MEKKYILFKKEMLVSIMTYLRADSLAHFEKTIPIVDPNMNEKYPKLLHSMADFLAAAETVKERLDILADINLLSVNAFACITVEEGLKQNLPFSDILSEEITEEELRKLQYKKYGVFQ